MNWDQLYTRVKQAAEKTAEQINYSTDLATLQVRLTVAEQRLEKAYAALGKTAYQHFTSEENTAEAVAKSMLLVEDAKKVVLLLKHRIVVLKKQRAAELAEQKKALAESTQASKAPVAESPEKPVEIKEEKLQPDLTVEEAEGSPAVAEPIASDLPEESQE